MQITVFNRQAMGNKQKRRSRRLETLSPERETNNTQLETPNSGNDIL